MFPLCVFSISNFVEAVNSIARVNFLEGWTRRWTKN